MKYLKSYFTTLESYALSVFKCGAESIHGIGHWRNVDNTAQLICGELAAADPLVVRSFAFLHDTWRCSDGADIEHGPRGAAQLAFLPQELAVFSADQLSLLSYAIRHHTEGKTSEDPTIGACWDADRLDLGRVGIVPSARYMSTQPGKAIALETRKRLVEFKSHSSRHHGGYDIYDEYRAPPHS